MTDARNKLRLKCGERNASSDLIWTRCARLLEGRAWKSMLELDAGRPKVPTERTGLVEDVNYKGCLPRDDAFWFQEEAEPADRGS